MSEAVIVATARTPIGRAFKGSLIDYRADDMAGFIVKSLLDKGANARDKDHQGNTPLIMAAQRGQTETVRLLLVSTVTTQPVKEALTKAVELRGHLADTQRELAHVELQLKEIVDDQTRLRANLREMPPTSAAYKRYLEKFDTQETEIEKLRAETREKGLSIIPTKLYLKAGLIKLEIAVAKGKKFHDKREAIKAREMQAEARAAIGRRARE